METKMHIDENKNISHKRCVGRIRRSHENSDVFRHDFFMLWQPTAVFLIWCVKLTLKTSMSTRLPGHHPFGQRDSIQCSWGSRVDRCWWVVAVSSPPWWCIIQGPIVGSISLDCEFNKKGLIMFESTSFLECQFANYCKYQFMYETWLNY